MSQKKTLDSKTTDRIADVLRQLPDIEYEVGKPVDLKKAAEDNGVMGGGGSPNWKISYET